MLTRKQHELLMFIHERIKETGVSPSFDEMKDALDLASKSGIHRLITALEERGFLRRLAHRARALEVTKMPESAAPAGLRTAFKPAVVEATLQPPQAANDSRELSILGKIAAGTLACERDAGRITVERRRVPDGPLIRGERVVVRRRKLVLRCLAILH